MNLTDDQKTVQELATRVATQVLKPRAREIDSAQMFPRDGMLQLAESGFLGMTLPETMGGQGKDTLSFVLACEAIARVCASTALVFVTHETVMRALAAAGSEEQRKHLLPAMMSGKKVGALAATESTSGSNTFAIITKANHDGDDFVVNGTKMFITGAREADVYVVLLRTDQAKSPVDFSAIIIEKGTDGFSFGKKEESMGLRGACYGELVFRNCRVPRSNLLGAENGYLAAASKFGALPTLGAAGISLGIAQAAIEAATDHAKSRKIAGQPIGQYQGVQFLIAETSTSLAAARELTYSAATQVDGPQPSSPTLPLMAKLCATEMAIDVTNRALQVHGGNGYSRDLPLERYCRDARGLTLHFTPSEMLKGMLGRMLMGMPPM